MKAIAQDISGPEEQGQTAAATRSGLERKLIAAALAGDGEAFGALVRPHLSVLWRVAARACGPDLAEDAVQEALEASYTQLGRYQPGSSFRAFLAAIVVRRAHTLVRAERRRSRREEASAPPEFLPTAEESLDAAQTAAAVRRVLSEMPAKRQQAAILRLDGGLSFAEIAAALNTSEGSARVLTHLALKELKEKLREMLESGSS